LDRDELDSKVLEGNMTGVEWARQRANTIRRENTLAQLSHLTPEDQRKVFGIWLTQQGAKGVAEAMAAIVGIMQEVHDG
jgi:hypothetical protein